MSVYVVYSRYKILQHEEKPDEVEAQSFLNVQYLEGNIFPLGYYNEETGQIFRHEDYYDIETLKEYIVNHIYT